MHGQTTRLRLPVGLWRGGDLQCDAVVAALPEDDPLPLERAGSPAACATRLLARCVERVGAVEPFGEEEARSLTAGDREALLLAVRRATLGERLPCVLDCPSPDCGERLEVELCVEELLVDQPTAAAAVHEVTVRGRLLRFRLPTGADQERAAATALHDVDAAVRELLCACVEGLSADDAGAALADELGTRMEELDPQAELTLAMTCPECERAGTVAFDAVTYLLAELGARARRLEQEVHALATAYGWSEREIVALGHERRRRYLDHIAEAAS